MGSSILNALHQSSQRRFAGEACVASDHVLSCLKDGADVQGRIDQLHACITFISLIVHACLLSCLPFYIQMSIHLLIHYASTCSLRIHSWINDAVLLIMSHD